MVTLYRPFPYSAVSTHVSKLSGKSRRQSVGWSESSQALCSLVPKQGGWRLSLRYSLLKGIKNATEIEGMRNSHVSEVAWPSLCSVVMLFVLVVRWGMVLLFVSTWPGLRKRLVTLSHITQATVYIVVVATHWRTAVSASCGFCLSVCLYFFPHSRTPQ